MNSMTQADDVHSTPPTNTSATTLPAGLKSVQDSFYRLILARAQLRGGTSGTPPVQPAGFFAMLIELHTNARLFAPDNVAPPMLVSCRNVQRDLVGNTHGARHIERRSDRGYVSDRAINTVAVELNRSGLKYAMSKWCTALLHAAALKQIFKSPVNDDRGITRENKAIW
jgi:hypothetical protein